MRPHSPPHHGLILVALLAATMITLFGSAYFFPAAQAQDTLYRPDVQPAMAVAKALTAAVSIQHTNPTYRDQSITFTATVDLPDVTGLTFTWDFGDGGSANSQVVHHTYTMVGNFPVRVFVKKGTDDIGSAIVTLTISEIPPTATPTLSPISITPITPGPYEAQQPITFLAVINRSDNLSFNWDFGDGTSLNTGSTATHEYTDRGTYTICVTTSDGGVPKRSCTTITIADATPKGLSFTYSPNPAILDRDVTLTANVERGTNVTYQWYISDGTILTGKVVNHLFSTVGTNRIRLVASNNSGSIEINRTISIITTPPIELTVVDDSPQPVKTPISFRAFVESRSSVAFQWDWGDHNSKRATPLPTLPAGQRIYQAIEEKAYDRPGKYPVCVTGVNASGHVTLCMVTYVGVARNPKNIEYEAPTLPLPKVPVQFAISEPGADQWICKWEFIDPSISPGDGDDTEIPGLSATYTFSHSGNYVVSIVCTDSTGASRFADFVVTVAYPSFMALITNNDYISRGPDGRTGNPPTTSEETPVPTVTATATNIPVPTNTSIPPTDATTLTETPVPPTATAIPATATMTMTVTPTATSTETPALPTATPTFIPTAPTATPTPTEPLGGTIPQP